MLKETGSRPLAGSIFPTTTVGFWNNFWGRGVIRGGIGDVIPRGGRGSSTSFSQLALGCTLTDHDAPLFGAFALYVSAVMDTPLAQG
jgi:hypothetical protein